MTLNIQTPHYCSIQTYSSIHAPTINWVVTYVLCTKVFFLIPDPEATQTLTPNITVSTFEKKCKLCKHSQSEILGKIHAELVRKSNINQFIKKANQFKIEIKTKGKKRHKINHIILYKLGDNQCAKGARNTRHLI